MRGSLLANAGLGVLLLALAACDFGLEDEERPPTPEPIPAGAQQVHITMHHLEGPDPNTHRRLSPRLWQVVLTPNIVRAGAVYLVIGDGIATFVERKTAPNASPGPLADWQIAKISRSAVCPEGRAGCLRAYARSHPDVLNDTWVTDVVAGYCDPRDDPATHGTGLSPTGSDAFCKVLRADVRPGRYLIILGPPPVDGSAVLTVTP